MNAEPPARGLTGVLQSLNGDRGYGLALLLALGMLLLPEWQGDAARHWLAYDRPALAQGQWWRVVSAHLVHLDVEHVLLNGLGLVLMWALFARDFRPWHWVLILLGSALAVSAGLWFLNPELVWYVGASGVLHGVMTAGTLAHLRRGDLDGWILAVFVVVKLGYEQFVGSLPFAGSADTVVDAHLYGAVGGLTLAILVSWPRRPG